MGDRCYVNGLVKRADWEKFKELTYLGDEYHIEESDDVNAVAFVVEEANYGFHDEARKAAKNDLTFVSYNTAGDGYGMFGAFSTGNGVLHLVPVDAEYSIAVSLKNSSPEIDPAEMERAVAAWSAERECYEIFKHAPDAQEGGD
jgi:hypothetical protein